MTLRIEDPVTVEEWEAQFEPAWPIRGADDTLRIDTRADNGLPNLYHTAERLQPLGDGTYGTVELSLAQRNKPWKRWGSAHWFDHEHYTEVVKTRYKERL